ncbi:hypothetical protein L5515_017819 [Caenorhabditis briggsae]|uniref:Uncharacterized protein n=1 Tax=Caenorhabditis briggsae TaxID=6238 RepID=A0AAE9FKI4_CAEBR|nr:hypothetical protein L5515_017819 [Caenorhabditis briggsae]
MSLSQTIKAIAMTTANVSIVSDSLPKITGAIPDEIWMIVALVVGIILIVSETCCEIFYAVRIFQMIYKYVISNQKNLLHFYFHISIGLMGSSNLTYLVLDMMALQLPAANVRFLATEIIKIAHFVTEYYSTFFTYLFCLLRFLFRPFQRKEKRSLFLTTLSMVLPFILNAIYGILSSSNSLFVKCFLMFRTLFIVSGNLLVVEIFYETHGIFRKKKQASISTVVPSPNFSPKVSVTPRSVIRQL